ncbi:MAG: gliding motility-associated C-terminal domain-containing protein [Crocinitomicaceae bacterium]
MKNEHFMQLTKRINNSRLSLLMAGFVVYFGSLSFAQDTLTFGPGTSQYVVPNGCGGAGVELTMGGAPGGGPCGGTGALLNGIIPINAGDVIDIIVGQSGGCPNPIVPGGGQGWASTNGNASYNSCSGGGLTQISINGVVVAIVGAGGGEGGGSVNSCTSNSGGDGGCASGVAGGNTFGQGGQPGTQVGPGAGGNPWAGTPPGGSPGVGTSGGMGGLWQTASGGGGGAGYFGGGGGGNDGCCTGANGGGGGGGGSSLIPAGIGCITGGNNGPAEVEFIFPVCATTICEGDTAFIDFSAQFPAGATNYTVSPGTGVYQAVAGGSNIGLFPTDTTTYDVTATVAGSPVTIQWPVNVVHIIEPDAGIDDSICFDPLNGATLNGTLYNDGVYSWSLNSSTTFNGAAGTATFTPSATTLNPMALVNLPGYYEFFLTEEDTNGVCPDGVDTVFVYYSQEMSSSTHTDPICYGSADGTITVTSDSSPASGNLGANSFTIDNGTTQTTQTNGNFTGLVAGVYTVTTMDYLGCTHDTTITLTDPAPIIMSPISSDTMICQNGTATMNVIANNAPAGVGYTYYWSAGSSSTNQNVITPTPAGTNMSVDVYAISDDGCYSDTITLDIDHYLPITGSITANDTICPGYDAVQQLQNINGGYQGYNYAWTANGSTIPNIDDIIYVNPTQNTQYCVTVSDGCETTPLNLCTNVLMRTVPSVVFGDPFDGCVPSTVTLTNLTSNVTIDSVNWYINGVYYQGPLYNDSLTVSFSEVGSYDVSLEVYSIYGCHDAVTYTDYIVIHDVPSPLFYVNPNPTNIFNTSVEMNNLTSGANNTYVWQFPGGTPSTSVLANPSVYYPEGVVGDYPITLVATNEWGCVADVTAVAHVLSDVILFAPNIFTPDGDEFNEKWRVYIDGIDIYQFHLTMFNRWGEPVWESFNQIAEWNGTYGSGDIVPDGTYVWVIECREASTDKKYEFRGHVTVLK